MLSERISRVEASATLKLADKASQLRREGKDVISLSVGEPDFPTPDFIKEGAKEALDRDLTGYTDTPGLWELREAIAEKFRNDNSLGASPEEVLVTPGAKFGIYLAFQSLVDPGDPVVLIDPSWVSYEAVARVAGAEVRRCPVGGDLLPRPADFEERVEGASLAVINSPCNPTGAVYPPGLVEELAEIAEEANATVLSDEVYEKVRYEGEHYSPAKDFDDVITVNGFSKSYSMTGWRLGYLHASRELVENAKNLQSHSATCATSFAQWGGLVALREPEKGRAAISRMVRSFRTRRDFLVDALNRIEGISCVEPKGAFYAFPEYDLDMGSHELADELLENGVAVTPGGAFGPRGEGYLRISYAVSEDKLNTAVERLGETLKELSE